MWTKTMATWWSMGGTVRGQQVYRPFLGLCDELIILELDGDEDLERSDHVW